MARIKKFAGDIPQGLSSIDVFLLDNNINSDYFRITEFKETFTGGKNGFLIEGSEFLRETTEVKIEILDVEGNTIYYEPGEGIPEYYEGISKVISVHIYEDTPIGIAKITILGELKQYLDEGGVLRDIPEEWQGLYNVKWERSFKINKNLTNEDKVRFYRRPDVAITEISRPIFTANPVSVTQTGNVLGTPLVPAPGTNINTFPRPSQYLLTTLDNTRWTGSVVNSTISIDGQTLRPLEVVSDTELIVSTPYTENNIVTSFNSKPYSTTFNYLPNDDGLGTALSGSFGKFVITNLETFVGDVHRIKVFRTSQSDLTDFQFVQEIVLESTEILIDYEQSQRDEESYGLFTPFILDEYWELSSANITKEFNQSFLFNSVKLDSIGTNTFHTKGNVPISNGIEYTLSFNTRIPSVVNGNSIEVYLQGTKNGVNITQSIGTVESSGTLLQKTLQEFNFIARDFDDCKLYFKVTGENWYISTVSLRAAQESSFSPDEITFIQTVPRTLEEETFDFRFEFYDINNNYIPVLVTASKTFSAGNLNEIQKNIEIVATSLYFQFDSGSQQGNALPPKSIFFNINREFLTGSITWTSESFDNENNLIDPSLYSSTFYPGLLEDASIGEVERYKLTVENFSGSIYENVVQYITYTAAVEGVSDNITISRLVDGKGGVNYEIRPYRGTVIRNSNTASSVEVQAIRIDGINETNLRAGLPLDYSVPLLYITSESLEGDLTYITLAEASSSGYVEGLVAGSTGSGEINYNAEFNRDAIDGQRTLYLIPSTATIPSESILTSLTLTDLQDGLDRGTVKYNTDTFTIDPYVSFENPTTNRIFTPPTASVTGSFLRRGQTENPISGTLQIYPSMSINSDFNPEFWLYYITGTFDNDLTFSVFDENDNLIQPHDVGSGLFDGSTRNQHKQLTVTFTYVEPFTTSSVSVEQTFTIVPEGKPGDDAIIIELEPRTITLDATETRVVSDYSPTVTNIRVKQGNKSDATSYLRYLPEREPGTFYITDIIGNNITPGEISGTPLNQTLITTTEMDDMTNIEATKQANVLYNFEIRPFFTSSYFTTSVSQSITRVDEGAAGRTVNLTANTSTVIYDGNGNLVSPNEGVVLTATSTGTTGSNYFYFYRGNEFIGEVFVPGSTIVTRNIDVNTLPKSNESATFRVELHDGNQNRGVLPYYVDDLTIVGVQDGTVNYSVSLTNQNAAAFVDVYGDLSLDNTGTQILAFKGGEQLTAVETFSTPVFNPFDPDNDDFDPQGNPIPNGEYKVTIVSVDSYLDLAGSLAAGSTVPVVSDVATIGDLDNWTSYISLEEVPQNTLGRVVFEIDFEDGLYTTQVVQNISLTYEGRIGPGIVLRGEWTGDLEYIYSVPQKRRDAVLRNISGTTHYWAMTSESFSRQRASAPYTDEPVVQASQGQLDPFGWQYLGEQEFFVAAKISIFDESFVRNTINVGNEFGSEFANIVIAGGRPDPFIAIGQTSGSYGYLSPGAFIGAKRNLADDGNIGVLSLKSATASGNSLSWDGENLTISGSIFAQNGKIGGWTIGETTLTGGAATLSSAGSIFFAGTGASSEHTLVYNGGIQMSSILNDTQAGETHAIEFSNYPFGGFPNTGFSVNIGTLKAIVGFDFDYTFNIDAQYKLLITAGSPISIYSAGGVNIGNPLSSGATNYISGVAISTPTPGGATTISRAKPLTISFTDVSITSDVDIGGGYNNSGTTINSSGDIFMDGTLYADGNVIAYYSSDKKLKLNTKPIQNSLDKILQIGGYEFDWDETKQKDFKGHDVGVIAQEIQKVLPEVVREKNDGYLGVKYEKIIPLLIESIKELSYKVTELEEKLKNK